MRIEKIFLVFLLATIVFSFTHAWRRRRTPPCNSSPCLWKWSSCSRSCGGGYQSPEVTRSAGPCGSCSLPSRRSCNTFCCRVDCRWAPWGPYGSCSASCQGGTSVRTRSYLTSASCGGSSCLGSSTSSRTCNDVCCPVDCQWTQWTGWDACSKTCGNGTQSRHRNVATYSSCGGRSCQGSEKEERLCNDHCCPVDCLLSQWSAWGVCNATCGTGTQTRSRRIARQDSCGGNACQGHMEESQSCNSHCCPVDCKMNEWSDWSECSATCGPSGVSARNRFEDIPPICGGASCPKERKQTRVCNRVCMNNGTMDDESCSCTPEWSGECCLTDIDECAANPCGEHTKCKNIPGSFECSCEDGFKTKNCSDISESCKETGSEATASGSSGNSINKGMISENKGIISCRDINECVTSANHCHKNATCKNVIGSFECRCNDGFTGDGKECQNFDECILQLHECGPNARCIDLKGTYECKCDDGFDGDGIQCTDIDECATDPCGENTECKNIPGSFECSCKEGFKAESMKCNKNVDGENTCAEKEALGNHSSELNAPANEKLDCTEISEANLNNFQKLGSEQFFAWKQPVLIAAGTVAGILLVAFLVLIYRKRRSVPEQQYENSSFKYEKHESQKASDDSKSNSGDNERDQNQDVVYEELKN